MNYIQLEKAITTPLKNTKAIRNTGKMSILDDYKYPFTQISSTLNKKFLIDIKKNNIGPNVNNKIEVVTLD